MKRNLFSLLLALTVSVMVHAQNCTPVDKTVSDAIHLLVGRYGIANPDSALMVIRTYADRGNASAIHALGIAHLQGLGVERNPDKAIAYLTEAARSGYPNAWLNLGLLYQAGDGVLQDYGLAKSYYEQAIAHGCRSALYPLGCLAYYGMGQAVDYRAALEHFEQSASLGQPESMYMTGICYEYGKGTPTDVEAAKVWMEAARLNGIRAAAIELKKLEAMQDSLAAPRVLAEMHAYPNPFETELTVEFELTEPAKVRLSLSSLSRLNLCTQTTDVLEPGKHSIQLTPNLPGGIYLLSVTAKNDVFSTTLFRK